MHKSKIGRLRFRLFAFASAFLLISVPALNDLALVANAATSADAYCAQYTSGFKLSACKDGVLGKDCSEYAIVDNQSTADVCTKAAADKANGLISDTPTFTPTSDGSGVSDAQVYKNVIQDACNKSFKNNTSAYNACVAGGQTSNNPPDPQDCFNLSGSLVQGACIVGAQAGQSFISAKNDSTGGGRGSSSPGGNTGPGSSAFQDALNQTKTASQYIDTLHALGPDSKVDTTKEVSTETGFYINGAGKRQPIHVIENGINNSPAIIFLNGGGWHGNDGTSNCVTYGAAGYHSSCGDWTAASTDGNPDNNAPPVGGGSRARGYKTIEVTYRLGSSGIYYMFEDVMRGINHVIKNAEKYHIDPNKVAVWGDSAGGSLAIRAAASGKSGVRAAVGWSPPTNAYQGLFRSYKSLFIGMDHSTCIPTDLAGAANFTSLLTGGSGDVAKYGQGLSSNDFTSFGIANAGADGATLNPITLLTDVLTAGKYAMQTAQSLETISKQLQSGGIKSMSGSVINLSAKKLTECIDNFNVMSPAMFASPDSPPMVLAGFNTDDVVGPEQEYGMRDKLQSLGITAEAIVIDGNPNGAYQAFGPNEGNHLGYDARFVCPTINFLDRILQPEKGQVDCQGGP